MAHKVLPILAVLCLTIYSPSAFAINYGYKEGELIVRFAQRPDGIQRTTSEKNTIIASLGGGEAKRNYKLVPGLTLVKLPEGVKVEDVLVSFNMKSEILYAQPNYILKAASTFPYDVRFKELWGLHNTGQSGGAADSDIDAPEAWDIVTDSNIIVAVIDSGVDYNHPDLKSNMWINPGEDHKPYCVVSWS
ncbi:MAG: hypothetical protein JW749_03525 [Sedimentisphaerales bacterium]|nr:hypothetical protein [Sedimentisphaerales bacterium]